jgi:hypothetical protein
VGGEPTKAVLRGLEEESTKVADVRAVAYTLTGLAAWRNYRCRSWSDRARWSAASAESVGPLLEQVAHAHTLLVPAVGME